jgi:hypothetical protein
MFVNTEHQGKPVIAVLVSSKVEPGKVSSSEIARTKADRSAQVPHKNRSDRLLASHFFLCY